jgi:hypothetical protein
MFGKYNGFVSKARDFCMHVFSSIFLGLTTALCSESDWWSTSNVLMLMLFWNEKNIRNSMYLPPNTRLIHKTNNRLALITVFCFRVAPHPPPVTSVTTYETQELILTKSIVVQKAKSVPFSKIFQVVIKILEFTEKTSLKALENLLEFIFTIGWNPENGLVKNTIHT